MSARLAAGFVALLIGTGAEAPQSNARTVLDRAGQYVLQYHDELTTVVADEIYVQQLTSSHVEGTTQRTIRSAFAIVRGGEDGWFAIRDVLEVDGRLVEERAGIDALLKSPPSRLRALAFAAATEQAKYNLGHVYRTINVPTLPLLFLLPDRQTRFRFKAAGVETVSGRPLNVFSFEERERPTIIRTPTGRSVVSRGTVWIEATAGHVRKTELITNEPRGLKAVITVTYEHEQRLALLVPVKMHESYVTADEQITATATYTSFRRFETDARIVR